MYPSTHTDADIDIDIEKESQAGRQTDRQIDEQICRDRDRGGGRDRDSMPCSLYAPQQRDGLGRQRQTEHREIA